MILCYTTCASMQDAKKIAKYLLEKRLSACINIVPGIFSMYLEGSHIEKTEEVTLFIKTLKEKYSLVEKEIKKIHPYKNPSIFSILINSVEKNYLKWLTYNLKKGAYHDKTS